MNNSDNISKVETTTTTTTTTGSGSFMEHLKDMAHKSWEKVGEGFEITKQKVGEGYVYTKEKVGEGVQVSKEHLTNLGHAINEQLPEKIQYHPDGSSTSKTVEEKVIKNPDGSTTIEKEEIKHQHVENKV